MTQFSRREIDQLNAASITMMQELNTLQRKVMDLGHYSNAIATVEIAGMMKETIGQELHKLYTKTIGEIANLASTIAISASDSHKGNAEWHKRTYGDDIDTIR